MIPTSVLVEMATLGLSKEQAERVGEMLKAVEDATREAAEATIDKSREKARARLQRWKDKNKNVSERSETFCNAENDSREGVTRVEDNLLPKKISGQEENKNISPEADKSAPVAVVGLPTVSEGDFPVSQADIDGWAEAFPGVDVRQQLAAMRQWLLANPTRRKTKRGMRKFVVSWLDRRQNAGQPPAPRATAPPQPSKPKNAGELARQDLIRMGQYPNATSNPPRLVDDSDGNTGFAGTGIARRIALATSGGRQT